MQSMWLNWIEHRFFCLQLAPGCCRASLLFIQRHLSKSQTLWCDPMGQIISAEGYHPEHTPKKCMTGRHRIKYYCREFMQLTCLKATQDFFLLVLRLQAGFNGWSFYTGGSCLILTPPFADQYRIDSFVVCMLGFWGKSVDFEKHGRHCTPACLVSREPLALLRKRN